MQVNIWWVSCWTILLSWWSLDVSILTCQLYVTCLFFFDCGGVDTFGKHLFFARMFLVLFHWSSCRFVSLFIDTFCYILQFDIFLCTNVMCSQRVWQSMDISIYHFQHVYNGIPCIYLEVIVQSLYCCVSTNELNPSSFTTLF